MVTHRTNAVVKIIQENLLGTIIASRYSEAMVTHISIGCNHSIDNLSPLSSSTPMGIVAVTGVKRYHSFIDPSSDT